MNAPIVNPALTKNQALVFDALNRAEGPMSA
jgi:Fur family transcriptional regulator, zinc uptake regulator